VLIHGENGSGKELVARAIHALSGRREASFVEVNCAAIPEELIESELFGHERGAFTGAVARRRGKFETADGGTLFLDEIGDMSLKTQAKVLRALEEQVVERVGGREPIKVDVRVIAASNRDLQAFIAQGGFREDLFYRLNVIPIEVPPLRQRRDDIPTLIEHFIAVFSAENGKRPKTMSGEALAYFLAYDWPGNVRELRNMVERLVIMTTGEVIGPTTCPPPASQGRCRRGRGPALAQGRARRLRARVHLGRAAQQRLEHDAHRRAPRHRALAPLPQDQDVRHHPTEVAGAVGSPSGRRALRPTTRTDLGAVTGHRPRRHPAAVPWSDGVGSAGDARVQFRARVLLSRLRHADASGRRDGGGGGVTRAAVMMGTPANRALLEQAGLLAKDGAAAAPPIW